jgi:hypothetical protein
MQRNDTTLFGRTSKVAAICYDANLIKRLKIQHIQTISGNSSSPAITVGFGKIAAITEYNSPKSFWQMANSGYPPRMAGSKTNF